MIFATPRPWILLAGTGLCLLCTACTNGRGAGFENYIRRDGDRLKDGRREFRFVSFNIPNLHYIEDDLRFEQIMPFRLPDRFEIDDALATINQIGGQVARMYALSVRRGDDPVGIPRHILGPGGFNEDAFVALDEVLAAAHRHRVRIIVPFIDQHSWWGGTAELAGFRGRKPEEFWTDAQVKADYKAIVAFVLNRVNTVTGIPYCEDKAVLAWETGNELKAPDGWTREMAAYIKSLDSSHLVLDGAARETVSEASLDDPNIDFVQTHHYEKDPRRMIDIIRRNSRLAAGRKPYHVGEFGFLSTEAHRAVLDTVIRENTSGALLWSLRFHSRDGGFYWHHEPFGGDLFKAYHWPGFEISETFDERRMVALLREKAYEIRGATPPPLPAPLAPRLLSVTQGGQLLWRGSVGAEGYDVQRRDSPLGPWRTVGRNVSDARIPYQSPFADADVIPGEEYSYRLTARNCAGSSSPSNTIGPVRIAERTLVDELWNDSRIFLVQGNVRFHQNDARRYKEDCHRLSGEPGSAVVYRVDGELRSVRVYAFSRADQEPLRLSVSADGRSFDTVESRFTRTTTYSEPVYGFLKADLYTVTPPGPQCQYLRIEFRGETHLARIEIGYE